MTGFDILLLGLGGVTGAAIDLAARRYAGMTGNPDKNKPGLSTVIAAAAGMLVAMAAVLSFPAGNAILLWLTVGFGWTLLALAAIDLRTYLLPDGLNLGVFLLGGIMAALYRPESWPWHVAGAAAGYGLLWLVETAYRRLRGMDGLGRGDAKLLGAIGMWVSLEGIPPVLLMASLCGILAALIQAAVRREAVSGQSVVAFGPWIALGGYAVWIGWAAGLPGLMTAQPPLMGGM